MEGKQSEEELAENPKKHCHHASFAVGDSIDSAASEGEDKEEVEDVNPGEITYVNEDSEVVY